MNRRTEFAQNCLLCTAYVAALGNKTVRGRLGTGQIYPASPNPVSPFSSAGSAKTGRKGNRVTVGNDPFKCYQLFKGQQRPDILVSR